MAAHEVQVQHAELLGVAVELAHLTGALIRDGREAAGAGLTADTKTTPTDLVTAVDKQAEQFLVEQLRERRPGDAVLGEEGADEAGSTGVRWLIDPIDGTVNFYYGVPQYAVSVAAEYAGQTVVGAVHNPISGETFMALRGAGSWLGSRKLTAAGRAASLDTALIGTGFGYDAGRRGAQGRILAGVLPRVANIRRLGSAALDLCFVAAGRLDGYFEQGLAPWDMAAGALVAAEAGALVSGLHGRPAGPAITVAAAPAVAGELVALLEELGADEIG
ncbi:MAG TPA: inositol monophosphatase family protein [Mycobacteriales bacterium]|nr:inositol monophosphatase family protein [Mycobacteriales bacterium]